MLYQTTFVSFTCLQNSLRGGNPDSHAATERFWFQRHKGSSIILEQVIEKQKQGDLNLARLADSSSFHSCWSDITDKLWTPQGHTSVFTYCSACVHLVPYWFTAGCGERMICVILWRVFVLLGVGRSSPEMMRFLRHIILALLGLLTRRTMDQHIYAPRCGRFSFIFPLSPVARSPLCHFYTGF